MIGTTSTIPELVSVHSLLLLALCLPMMAQKGKPIPIVTIVSPQAGAVLSGIVPVQVMVTDKVRITSVAITVNGLPLCSFTAAPYFCDWDSAAGVSGPQTITATAIDQTGSKGSASVTVTVAPRLQIVGPFVVNSTSEQPHSIIVRATGGLPPYQWRVFSTDVEPGITFSQSGNDAILSGVDSYAGSYNFVLQVQDAGAAQTDAIGMWFVKGG